MFVLVPAHQGLLGQNLESCKMVVCMCVWVGGGSFISEPVCQ